LLKSFCISANHLLNPNQQRKREMAPSPTDRLKNIASHLIPGAKANTDKLPSFDELPNFRNFTGCAWGVWGPEDELGTVNLLTDEVVQKAASEEIQ
jgi:hypothetical protein